MFMRERAAMGSKLDPRRASCTVVVAACETLSSRAAAKSRGHMRKDLSSLQGQRPSRLEYTQAEMREFSGKRTICPDQSWQASADSKERAQASLAKQRVAIGRVAADKLCHK